MSFLEFSISWLCFLLSHPDEVISNMQKVFADSTKHESNKQLPRNGNSLLSEYIGGIERKIDR